MNPLFNICSEFLIDRIIMADTRKKASMSQVLADIKPYITKKFMAAPRIKEQDIQECAAHSGIDQQQAGFQNSGKRFVWDRRETV